MMNSSLRSILDQSSGPEASSIEEGDDELFQSMMQKLKPVSDDMMNKLNESLRCDGSISELSHSVNDSARGHAFDQVYDKKEELGEGGFAIVYRCLHKERKYSYAVKVVFNENYEIAGENIKEEINFVSFRDSHDGSFHFAISMMVLPIFRSHYVTPRQ